jgi:replicative DNA helicase
MNNTGSAKRQYQKDSGSTSEFGRLPPHSIEAEESVLGAILLDNEAINTALEKIQSDDFYRAGHKAIFAAMTALSDKREPVDVITLSQELRAMGLLDEAGGLQKLTSLSSAVPSAANVAYYAKVVREHAMRRRLIHEATEIVNEAFNLENEIEGFLDKSEQRVLGVSEYRAKKSFAHVSEIVQDSIKLVETLYDRKEPVTGCPSGFLRLDELTAGFQPSDLIIIAARPSMGKTALALSIGQNVGLMKHEEARKKGGVAVFSLEMSKEQIVLRMLCAEARVDSSRVRTGNLAERDFPKLVDAASRIAEAPIFIDDTPAQTITELRAKARRLHREHPLSLIVVDYLQLMRSPVYSNSREQEISDISRSLKALAKELRVPVIALSQLNRSVESRNDKRPMMSDLRESGAIEQDADVIMFIYRDEVYNRDTTTDKGVAEIIISKQRSGPTGMVKLAFFNQYTRFDNLAEESDAYGSYSAEGSNGAAAVGDDSGLALDFGGDDQF